MFEPKQRSSKKPTAGKVDMSTSFVKKCISRVLLPLIYQTKSANFVDFNARDSVLLDTLERNTRGKLNLIGVHPEGAKDIRVLNKDYLKLKGEDLVLRPGPSVFGVCPPTLAEAQTYLHHTIQTFSPKCIVMVLPWQGAQDDYPQMDMVMRKDLQNGVYLCVFIKKATSLSRSGSFEDLRKLVKGHVRKDCLHAVAQVLIEKSVKSSSFIDKNKTNLYAKPLQSQT